jgi:hypothetical protein
MKKLVVLFLSVLTSGALLTSCSDDNEGSSIEGKWEFYQEGFSFNGQEQLEPWDHEEGCDKDYIEFLGGGVLNEVSYFNDGESCEESSEQSLWSKNGNTLTVTIGGESQDATIATLDATTLKIVITEDFEGMPVSVIVVFKRP